MDDLDLYTEIHKGLRKNLFELSLRSGNMDWSSPDDLAAFAPRLQTMLEFLRVHARDEEAVCHPMLRRSVLGLADQLEHDHREQETVEDTLEAHFDRIANYESDPAARRRLGTEFHRGLNRFLAMYLAHLNVEETSANAVLWSFCTTEEILGVYWAIVSSLTPEMMATSLEAMFPAMNVHERVIFMARNKAAMPPEAYAGLSAAAQHLVQPADWQAVVSALDGM